MKSINDLLLLPAFIAECGFSEAEVSEFLHDGFLFFFALSLGLSHERGPMLQRGLTGQHGRGKHAGYYGSDSDEHILSSPNDLDQQRRAPGTDQ